VNINIYFPQHCAQCECVLTLWRDVTRAPAVISWWHLSTSAAQLMRTGRVLRCDNDSDAVYWQLIIWHWAWPPACNWCRYYYTVIIIIGTDFRLQLPPNGYQYIARILTASVPHETASCW